MITKRKFIAQSLLAAGVGGMGVTLQAQSAPSTWYMPDESSPHERTWMAFGASRKIWGKRLLPGVRENLALIANTISEFEPVSMLARPEEMDLARKAVGKKVTLIPCPLDGLWMRDTGPLFVLDRKGNKAAVNCNFNGWGEKQEHRQDSKVASFIAGQAGVSEIKTGLVLEGGCVELDGEGTAIVTESCVLNPNRNPEFTKAEFEEELGSVLGLQKTIWLPGIRDQIITEGHTDFYARFARPGVALCGYDPDPKSPEHELTKQHLTLLKAATDAKDHPLKVTALEGPSRVRSRYETRDFAAGYIGFYVCNGAVISQEFGDKKTDDACRRILEKTFPDREIVQLNVDAIAAGGGSVHCATQQEPKA